MSEPESDPNKPDPFIEGLVFMIVMLAAIEYYLIVNHSFVPGI